MSTFRIIKMIKKHTKESLVKTTGIPVSPYLKFFSGYFYQNSGYSKQILNNLNL